MSKRMFPGWLAVVIALTLPVTAFAYVGPGAGLSLLSALWGLLVALGSALLFIVVWPIRRLFRGRGKTATAEQSNAESDQDSGQPQESDHRANP
ncbi:MAG: hypothetical protein L0H54_13970 [Alcaligenaceae bacterium]|nr:hypothetical protein [Alcaligenaceae bacterium]MDN5937591.1 hypothetical protein [Salinisphaera sp.]